MNCCSAGFSAAIAQQFNPRIAARDLARYRRKGPRATTRLLRDDLRAAGAVGGSLLDVGAGIGALTFELLAIGVRRAQAIDASKAYVAAAREEARRRGLGDAVEWRCGDFVSEGPELLPATIVTLDRVVCCYPAYGPLVDEAVRLAERWIALSYPRDRWYVRALVALENLTRRITGSRFRAFVQPATAMERQIRSAGFQLVSRRGTFAWLADVYVKGVDGC